MSTDISKTFEQLKPNIEEVKELAAVFKLYYDKLEHMGFSGTNPYETELLLKYLKQINNDNLMSKHLQAFSKATINFENPIQNEINSFISDAMSFYGALKANHYKLAEIYDIFENHKVEPFTGSYVSSATSMTKHDIEDIMKTFDYVQSNWNRHRNNVMSLNVENTLSEYILIPILKSPDIANKTLEHIHKLYKNGNGLHLIDLYSNILTHASEVETKNNRSTIQYVVKLVDELKAEVLPPINRQITNRKTNTLQNLVQRYRMIPDGPSRSLSVLIQDLTGVKINEEDPISALSKVSKVISKGRKYGFIIVAKIIPQPIEHNTWLLTDAAYLQKNNLSESTNSVTTTSIKRAQTIQNMKEVKPLIKDGVYRIDDTFDTKDVNSNFYYVLQTLDGATFHILYPWYISIFAQKIYEIPASYLANFGEIKTGPSTRIETYNSILCNEILKHLKPPMIEQEVGLSKLERKHKEIQWANVRKKITRGMIEDYEKLFETHKPTDTNIVSLILNPTIFQNALHHIIQGVSSTIESLEKTSNYYSEIYMAALSDLFKLRSNMSQEVENIYNEQYKDKIDKLLKGGEITRTVIKILDLLENILMEMLEKYINEKSNVYSIIQQKIKMMELIHV